MNSHPTHKKKNGSNTNDTTLTTEAATATQTTTAPAVAAPPAPASVSAAAKQVSAMLDQIAATLPFDDPSAKDIKAAISANRVPPAAMTIAAKVLATNPGRFPDLDSSVTQSAIDYDQALSPIVLQLTQLQQRTAKTILNRRGQGATQTLALYQVLKGLSRVSMNKATLVQQKQMEKLIKTSRKVRATSVTKKELKSAAKGMKASKKAQASAASAANANVAAQLAAAEAAVLGTSAGATASTAPVAPASPASPTPAAPPVTPSH